MTKNKAILIAIIAVLFGMWLGSAMTEKNPVRVETREVQIQADTSNWKKLKSIDDEAFEISGNLMQVCAAGYSDLLKGDASNMDEYTETVNNGADRINQLATSRKQVLVDLGY